MAHRGGFESSKLAILPTYHTQGRDRHAHVPLFGLSVNKKVDRKVDNMHLYCSSNCFYYVIYIIWCGREDSNFHSFYRTATSTLRVYQFRHDRTQMHLSKIIRIVKV